MKCPICGCTNFFVKDPEDQFEIYKFNLNEDGEICFEETINPDSYPQIRPDSSVYCDECAWNGRFSELQDKLK